MGKNEPVFKLSKHQKLWNALPDYILQEANAVKGCCSMQQIVSWAKAQAMQELFSEELYVVYDCFACQYTKDFGETYLKQADEKCCKYCPLAWKEGIQCGYRGNLLSILESLDAKKLNEKRVRFLCQKISEVPVKEGVKTE